MAAGPDGSAEVRSAVAHHPRGGRVGGPPTHGVSRGAFRSLTIVATGGPLALVALYVPGILGDNRHSLLIALLGIGAFVPALLVWLGYSRRTAGPGGLYTFVEAAAGRTVARVQAALWITSYFLYLVYTTTFVAYDVLAPVFPALTARRPVLQVLTAVVVITVCLLPIHRALHVMSILAVAELVLVATVLFAELRLPASGSATTHSPGTTAVTAANVSILFICASLPLFLGGEVSGGSGSIRRGLRSGWAIAAGITAVAMIPMTRLSPAQRAAAVPGVEAARSAGWPLVASIVGFGVAAAVGGVMVAEYLALTRLLHALSGWRVNRVSRALAAGFLVATVLSLWQPERVYEDLLKPSLVTLWLAQLLVFAWYPRYVRRRETGGSMAWALLIGAAGSALMIFGLWSTIQNQLGT